MISPLTFFSGVFQEVQKVVWPTRRTTVIHTAIVVASMIGIIAIVSGIDFLLINIIRWSIVKG
jgi:preprotein translocase subunit SecE